MVNTKNTGAIIETLPIKDVIIAGFNGASKSNFINKLNIIEGDKSKFIPVGSSDNNASSEIIPEKENANMRELQYTGYAIKPKRFAEAIEISENLKLDSALDNIEFIKKMAFNRILHGLEAQMLFKGYKDSDTQAVKDVNFERLFYAQNSTATSKNGESLKYADFLIAHKDMTRNGKIKDAFWLINGSAQFSVLDAQGNEKLNFDNIPESANATLLGLPVYMVSTMTYADGKQAAFGIVHPDAYALSLSDVKVKKAKLDTPQALQGKEVYIVELWADGVITDINSKRSYGFTV